MNKEPIKIDRDRASSIIKRALAFFSGNTTEPAQEPVEEPVKGKFAGATASYNVTGAAPVFVDISDDNLPGIDMGDNVYADAAGTIPYPDGTYMVDGTQFSFTIIAGVITNVTDAAGTGPGVPVAQAQEPQTAAPQQQPAQQQQPIVQPQQQPAPAPQQQPIQMPRFNINLPEKYSAFSAAFGADVETPESMFKQLTSVEFVAGTPDERLTALETMMKACMKYCFGYEIERAAQQVDVNNAITAYKDKIATLEIQLAEHKKTGLELTNLFQEFLNMPQAEPKTISEKDKQKFERELSNDERAERIATTLKNLKKEKA